MKLTSNEIEALFFLLKLALSLFSFFATLGTLALFKMGRDISSIKTTLEVQSTKHDNLEKEHQELKNYVYKN